MQTRTYERPQQGNAHRLTVKQHVFPASCIARFADDDGRVAIFDLQRRTSWRPVPGDQVFCARRVWDQRAEAGYMSVIEKSYQSLAERIIADPGNKLTPEDNDIVSCFFALWRERAVYRSAPDNPTLLNGVEGSALTKDQEELLESRWIGYVRADGVPARQIYGLNIQRNVDVLMLALRERRWGVLTLNEGELIVPDVPEHYFIPVTPNLCLAWGHESGQISGADAGLLNQTFLSGCQYYWFCRTLPVHGLSTI